MRPIVEAKGLALAGRLQETTLKLAGGELACLIGPNGSGKTSLLHALAGIGRPAGSVLIDGIDPRTIGTEQRHGMLAYLPASREIHWPLAAADLVALGLPFRNPQKVSRVMEELELAAFAHRRVDRLSTGERSRVLIARALVGAPRLLLLDEPVANLDPLWQLRLMDHLRILAHARGQSLLVAMHDLELARIYADRLIIMQHGRVAADGPADELLGGPFMAQIFGVTKSGGRWRPVQSAPAGVGPSELAS
jgi:iron complex transport system ATP-binding protein